MESRQVISGTEEGPRRPEKSQFLTSTRTRSRGRLGARHSALLQKHNTHHRQINLFQTQAFVCQYFLEPIVFQFKLHPWLIFTVIILNPQMTQSMIMWWKDQNRVDKLQWSGMQFYCAKSCCSLQWVSFFFKNIFQNSNSSVNHELDMILQVMSVLKCNQSGKTSQVVDLVTVTSQQQCHGKYSLFFSIQMWPVTFIWFQHDLYGTETKSRTEYGTL